MRHRDRPNIQSPMYPSHFEKVWFRLLEYFTKNFVKISAQKLWLKQQCVFILLLEEVI